MMVAILVITMVAGFLVVHWNLRRQFADRYEHRALSVAQTLTADPTVRAWSPRAILAARCSGSPPRVEHQTGALFVVIVSHQGIRLTHPNPKLIGTPIDYRDPEPQVSEPFRTGVAWMGIQHGTLGYVSAGKVPLWAATGS